MGRRDFGRYPGGYFLPAAIIREKTVAISARSVYNKDNIACFGAYGWIGPARRAAVNHVRRGTEQH